MNQKLSMNDLQRPKEFDAAIAPAVAQLLGLLDTAGRLPDLFSRKPADGSAAHAELAEQSAFGGEWGDHPILDGQSMIWLLIATAEMHARSTIELLKAERTGPSSVDALVRSALECLARAAWLADRSISVEERIKRIETERLYSAAEQKKLGGQFQKTAGEIAGRITRTATSLGWQTMTSKRGRPAEFVSRPTATDLVRGLFRDDDSNDLGGFSYRLLSASTHGTLYGLVRYAHVVDELSVDGVTIAAIAFNSVEVNLLLETLVLGLVNTLDDWLAHLGWGTPEWLKSAANARSFFRKARRRPV
jgi:hypothetical protein